MPEIKNQFTGGKMNKDLDERLVPKGEYVDAMNIQVSTSEGSDVGTIQNILGNVAGCENEGYLTSTSSFVVGSFADEKNDDLYWLVSGQATIFGEGTFTNDWSDITVMTDSIIRRTHESTSADPSTPGLGECHPVFVDKFAFTSPNSQGFSGTVKSLHSFSDGVTSQIEPGWTITGVDSAGGSSNTVIVSGIELGDPIQANTAQINLYFGNNLVVPLVSLPGEAPQIAAGNKTVYLEGYPSFVTPAPFSGLEIKLFNAGHSDYQTNQINSASYFSTTFEDGTSANYIKLDLINDIELFDDPLDFEVTVDTAGNLFGTSYQGSIIWGEIEVVQGTITQGISIPNNLITVQAGDLNVGTELYVGDGIATGNSNSCVGSIDIAANAFTIVDCASGAPVPVPTTTPFDITLPADTVINLSEPLYLSSSHSVFVIAKPRVLNFNHNEYITGINIIDDMLFWTDGKTEPKKINIERSVAGTASSGQEHTRLINNKLGINLSSNILAKEEHVTVIRKAPLKAPFLEMETSIRQGVVGGEEVFTANTGYVFGGKSTGDQVSITINDIDGTPPDFELGDILRLAGNSNDLPDKYEIRVSIIKIQSQPGSGSTIYTVQIESITNNSVTNSISSWYAELEETDSLFERKLPRFAYRYKYEDNEYSSFSPFTEVAFIPGGFEYHPKKAYNTGMINHIKSLTIKDFIPKTIPLDVVQVDILYKNEVDPTVYLLKSIRPGDNLLPGQPVNSWFSTGSSATQPYLSSDQGSYKISSENISHALSSSQSLRVWDNVPKKALTQELSGNRIIYGNYEIGYDAIQPQVTALLGSRLVDGSDFFGKKSIKSLRDYDIGIVWGDKYGRETPVKTSGSSVTVGKSRADNSSYIKASLENSPAWADYYRFYIKETSNEYYNLAVDRTYEAADDNMWVSFPSVDRNKVDEDTYIILKKGTENEGLVLEKARYKVVAIEDEAPEYIKTSFERLTRTNTDGSRPDNSCQLWGGSNDDITGACVLEAGENAPFVGMTGFSINARVWSENPYNAAYVSPTPGIDEVQLGMQLTSPKALLEEVSGNAGGSTTDELYVSFTQEIPVGAGINIKPSEKYRVVGVNDDEVTQDAGEMYYYINLDSPIVKEDDWITSYSDGSASPMTGDKIHVHFWKKTIVNKPEFDGRFFVKILSDQTALDYVRGVGLGISRGLRTRTTTPLYRIEDTQLTVDGGEYSFATDQLNESHVTGNLTYAKGQWDAMLKFGGSDTTAKWFVDKASFASKQKGGAILPPTGLLSHQDTQVKNFIDPSGSERYACDVTSLQTQSYSTTNGCSTPYQNSYGDPSPVAHDRYLGDGHSNGQVGMKGVHQSASGKYIDISYSKLDPNGGAVAENGYFFESSLLNWIVGSGNPDTDQEAKVVAGLREGERFRLAGSQVIYRILGVSKFRLFNYQGQNRSENHAFPSNIVPDWAGNGTSLNYNNDQRAFWATYCSTFWNAAHLDQIVRMQTASNRRSTYRIRYEVDLVFSEDGTSSNAAIDDTGEPYENISNLAFPPISAVAVNLEFLTDYTSEEGNPISINPAIFETEPKEDVDIDIYYEASSSIPTFPLTNKNKYSFIPIGSTLVNPTSSLPSGFPTGIFVVKWENINPLDPVYEIQLSSGLSYDEFEVFYSQDITYIEKDNGELVSFKIVGPVIDYLNNEFIGMVIEPRQEIGLNWSNCWSFGNGVESNRIGDTYNKPYLTNGATASSSTEELKETETRKYGLIYSGMYNSTSSVNNLNQFIAAEKITKDINPIYGSIQKLHAGWGQSGDLVALCEDRILKILANKDALFNADGSTNVISTNNVLGTAIPYSGEYGISKNPESFASEAYRVYFTDKVRGTVMRLSVDGLTPISAHGMKDWFKDNLKLSTKLIGSYDDKKEEYNLTLVKPVVAGSGSKTITFREDVKGWVSFKSFTPENAISCANEYFTFLNGKIWKHHVEVTNDQGKEINRNTFYNTHSSNHYSTFNAVLNDAPGSVKSFNTINYEGSDSRVVVNYNDATQYYNLANRDGWYVDSINTNKEKGSLEGFIEKEGKWFDYIKGEGIQHAGPNPSINPDGSSTFDQASLAIQGLGRLYSTPVIVDVYGCTESDSFNYDPLAITDDGSCIAFINGCLFGSANNYNSNANTDSGLCVWLGCTCPSSNCTNPFDFPSEAIQYGSNSGPGVINQNIGIVDDGSCIIIIEGCMNPLAYNYAPLANTDDGSCIAVVTGCAQDTDPPASNYSAVVNTDNGTCTWYGCDDNTANNTVDWDDATLDYQPSSTSYGIINDGSCTYDTGCTDEYAILGSYDSTAVVNDPDACVYCNWGNGIAGIFSSFSHVNESAFGNNNGSINVYLASGINHLPASITAIDHASGWSVTVPYLTTTPQVITGLAPGDYDIVITQDPADYTPGSQQSSPCVWTGVDVGFTPITISPGPVPLEQGCMDDGNLDQTWWDDNYLYIYTSLTTYPGVEANNYSSTAEQEDGSCTYNLGCTDTLACNYDATSNVDDGSCDYSSCTGCTDPAACDYDSNATIDNNACTYPAAYEDCNGDCVFGYVNTLNGCELIAVGCTDPTADNYNPSANTENYSCIYPASSGCMDCGTIWQNDTTDNPSSITCLTLTGITATDEGAYNYDPNATLDAGNCCYVSGCNDHTQFNYNPLACYDDGSCIPYTYGCTDPTADNYNTSVNNDDNTCVWFGCADPLATNYDVTATVDDGTCSY